MDTIEKIQTAMIEVFSKQLDWPDVQVVSGTNKNEIKVVNTKGESIFTLIGNTHIKTGDKALLFQNSPEMLKFVLKLNTMYKTKSQ